MIITIMLLMIMVNMMRVLLNMMNWVVREIKANTEPYCNTAIKLEIAVTCQQLSKWNYGSPFQRINAKYNIVTPDLRMNANMHVIMLSLV